jgi:hypothetical protein
MYSRRFSELNVSGYTSRRLMGTVLGHNGFYHLKHEFYLSYFKHVIAMDKHSDALVMSSVNLMPAEDEGLSQQWSRALILVFEFYNSFDPHQDVGLVGVHFHEPHVQLHHCLGQSGKSYSRMTVPSNLATRLL